VRARHATALLGIAAALLAPAAARADGDPASDVLLFQDAYLPYFPAPSKPEAETLTRLLAEVRADGYAMKVAVIAGIGDLGAYPDLFGRPADYAKLLASELTFRVRNPHLLIVMPDGLAGRNLGAGEEVLGEIEVQAEAETDGLVRTAIEAVARIASANGHPTEVPAVEADPEPRRDGGRSYLALYLVAGLLIALGLSLVAVALRIRGRRPPG
jgi:hypothetical protein